MARKIFEKKRTGNYTSLGTDVHSHLLPGLDDGARTTEEAVEIIRAMGSLGFNKIITTPHVMSDHHPNSKAMIEKSLAELKTVLKNENIGIQLEAAAEYYVDFEFSEVLGKHDLLTFGDKYILVEMPLNYPPNNIESVFFELQTMGLRPVLAHPERYGYWYNDFKNFSKLTDREIFFQINTQAFAFDTGNPIRKMAEKFASNQMISFLGSDTHNIKNMDYLTGAFANKHLAELLESGRLLNNTL